MFDVAIIGGGPAGSTAATLLAKAGRRVVVLEREKFPRFHIGESLLPFTMSAFERLGVTEKIEAAGFVPKYGAEITSHDGGRETKFYFRNGFQPQHEKAIQVTRADFDKLLLDHARECGADVREETCVESVAFHRDRVELKAKAATGESTITARYLLDCSGRQTVVGRHFNLKRSYPGLQKMAVYAHYDGVEMPCGIDGTLTRMVHAGDHWFWTIPLSPTRASVGVVMDTAKFKRMKLSPETLLDTVIAESPVMSERLDGAQRVSRVYSTSDYSYRNRRLYGDRWLLAGDAAGFIDPIFSSGVFLAVLSGESAADALEVAFETPRRRVQAFRDYSRRLQRVMKLYLRFVNGWYRTEFVETLLNPREFFDVVPAVNSVLAGNLGGSFRIQWRLWLFHAIVLMQRFFPLSPRLASR